MDGERRGERTVPRLLLSLTSLSERLSSRASFLSELRVRARGGAPEQVGSDVERGVDARAGLRSADGAAMEKLDSVAG